MQAKWDVILSVEGENTRAEVKSWLADALGRDACRDPVFRRVWNLLEFDGQIDSAVSASASGDEDLEEEEQVRLLEIVPHLVKYAEAIESSETASSTQVSTPRRAFSRVSFASERVRCRALGEYVALRVSYHPLVKKFRSKVLGGKPLSKEAAHRLVSSPAASRLSLDRFNRLDIPIVDHVSAFRDHHTIFKGERFDRFIHMEFIDVEPPGETIRTHLPVGVAYEDLPLLSFPQPEPAFSLKANSEKSFDESREEPFPVYPRSVLDDLRNLSIRLTEVSSDWTQAEAAWFVLTGEPISVSAITAEHVERSSTQNLGITIRMGIEPWVSLEKVAKVYEYMRHGITDKKPRAPERRNVEIFGFVSRRKREHVAFSGSSSSTSQLTLRQLMNEWNQENPDSIYTKESLFKRDYGRGAKAVLHLSNDADETLSNFMTLPESIAIR